MTKKQIKEYLIEQGVLDFIRYFDESQAENKLDDLVDEIQQKETC